MGLDQYVFKLEKGQEYETLPDDADPFFYWRKHPNLHGWMRELAKKKGVKPTWEIDETWDVDFDHIELTMEDLMDLKKATEKGKLPATSGFFFGETMPFHKEETLKFIKKALIEMKKGARFVYVHSW